MGKNDRRHSPRQRKKGITIQVLLTRDVYRDLKENCELIPANIINHSEGGLYIEIDRVLITGTNVSLKMVYPEGCQPGEAYTMHDGLVLRCEKVDDANSRFGVGIRTLRKVVQAPVLNSRLGKPAR